MKNQRQQIILDLINDKKIENQDQLQAELLKLGVNVTQSTISRDIRQLRILKVQDSKGGYYYSSHKDNESHENDDARLSKYVDFFKHSVVSIQNAMNIVVIKTYSGMASSACVMVDDMYKSLVVGSLAGDDTIFVATKSEADAVEFCNRLKALL